MTEPVPLVDVERQIIELAVGEIAKVNGGLVPVNWALVIDYVDQADGDRHLERLASKGTPTWVRDGMLHSAIYDDFADER